MGVQNTLMCISHLQDLLSKEARLRAVETQALSHINYGIIIWSTANITQLKREQQLRNIAAKLAIGEASKFDHAAPFLNKLQWLPIRQKVIYEQRLTSLKIMNNQLLSWLFCFPQVRNVYNTTNTRQQNLLHIPRTKTNTISRSMTVRGPRL